MARFILLVIVLIILSFAAIDVSAQANLLRTDELGLLQGTTEFCVNPGNLTDHYISGRYVKFPTRSSSSLRIMNSTFPFAACDEGTFVPLDGGTLPENLVIGDPVQLWSGDPNADTTPPTISNLTANSITQTGATITWTTNESATHTIKYGTTSGSYDSYPNTKAAGSGTSASGAL